MLVKAHKPPAKPNLAMIAIGIIGVLLCWQGATG